VRALDPILAATMPSFLTSLRFERFTFGRIPARIEGVKIYETEGEDLVEMDLDVIWKGDPVRLPNLAHGPP
jgi:Ca2+-dependent lipid-binding protein